MLLNEFDFELPEELIAQEPLAQRAASRMLLVDRAAQSWRDMRFADWPAQVRAGDVVAVNNTRVFPARLVGQRAPSGGRVELFLVRELENNLRWEVLAKPARRLRVGQTISFGDNGLLAAEIAAELPDGRRVVQFDCAGRDFADLLDTLGQTPLPPYIKRADEGFRADRERYQTVYARERGAIAAPTAGLHFTPATFDELRQHGAQLVEITLHVGYGTFAPVRATDISQHTVAAENYTITPAAAEQINTARATGVIV